MKFPKRQIETENRLVVSWVKRWEGELTVNWREGSS